MLDFRNFYGALLYLIGEYILTNFTLKTQRLYLVFYLNFIKKNNR